MKTDKTKVIFRKFDESDDIIAIFPEIPGTNNGWDCQSYMRVGQHGAADPHGILQITTLASAAEYGELKKELENIGYKLEVMKKITGKADRIRREAVN